MTARLLDASESGTEGRVEFAPWVGVERDNAVRTAVVVSADARLRRRLASSLTRMRWCVREASGGAQAMMHLEAQVSEAMLIDEWLPDLEVREFAGYVKLLYPRMDLLWLDGGQGDKCTNGLDRRPRSPRRSELLHAMCEALEPVATRAEDGPAEPETSVRLRRAEGYRLAADGSVIDGSLPVCAGTRSVALPGLVGTSACMRHLKRLMQLVAPRSTTVLIEGETGTGKQVVARALHQVSPRATMPFVVLDCAAIPESVLEAELFKHVRGTSAGAVQSRMGRVETANCGTLLLDEIGEMPLAMQAKMLRFFESGEGPHVGEGRTTFANVRLIATTHHSLERMVEAGTFRLDLYHRLAVFPIEVPPLRERPEDIAELAEHFLARLGEGSPRSRLSTGALARLAEHSWPGNVRELMHVLERGAILAGANPEIAVEDIRYRHTERRD